MPTARDEAAYYFLVRYRFNTSSTTTSYEAYSDIGHLKIIPPLCHARSTRPRGPGRRPGQPYRPRLHGRRMLVYLDTTRPAPCSILPVPSVSTFRPSSPTYLSRGCGGGGGTLSVGVFRADAAAVTVSPSSLTLRSGEQQALQFGLSNAAPQGGLLLDVTTDAPESVIMPRWWYRKAPRTWS